MKRFYIRLLETEGWKYYNATWLHDQPPVPFRAFICPVCLKHWATIDEGFNSSEVGSKKPFDIIDISCVQCNVQIDIVRRWPGSLTYCPYSCEQAGVVNHTDMNLLLALPAPLLQRELTLTLGAFS